MNAIAPHWKGINNVQCNKRVSCLRNYINYGDVYRTVESPLFKNVKDPNF